MKIQVKVLRESLKRMLDVAEEQFGEEIDLDYEMFWVIMFHLSQDFSKDPEPTIGDIRDDIEYIISNYEEDIVLCTLDYEKMGNIIKAIGHKIHER